MEIVVIVAVVIMVLLTGFLTYTVLKNNKKHADELGKLKADFEEAIKKATDSINGEGAAQTEIIKQKSAEEQEILRGLENNLTREVGAKLDGIEHTARRIHEDVHTNLKNIIFDNFPSREDKLKSRVMDKLTYAVKYAARDEKYMSRLMELLEKGEEIQGEVDEANRALHAELGAPLGAAASATADSAGAARQSVPQLSQEEIDAQLKVLADLMRQEDGAN